jgi:hypothetical protein
MGTCPDLPITFQECMNGLSKQVDVELINMGVPAPAAYAVITNLHDEGAFDELSKPMLKGLLTREVFMQHWAECSPQAK